MNERVGVVVSQHSMLHKLVPSESWVQQERHPLVKYEPEYLAFDSVVSTSDKEGNKTQESE